MARRRDGDVRHLPGRARPDVRVPRDGARRRRQPGGRAGGARTRPRRSAACDLAPPRTTATRARRARSAAGTADRSTSSSTRSTRRAARAWRRCATRGDGGRGRHGDRAGERRGRDRPRVLRTRRQGQRRGRRAPAGPDRHDAAGDRRRPTARRTRSARRPRRTSSCADAGSGIASCEFPARARHVRGRHLQLHGQRRRQARAHGVAHVRLHGRRRDAAARPAAAVAAATPRRSRPAFGAKPVTVKLGKVTKTTAR